MHIPENYLSPATCAVITAAMLPVWGTAIRTVQKTVSKEKMPLLGVSAAFSFLGMMFNIPLPGGTTGHAVGGTLIAILLGPEAACLSVSIALLLQALLFGDGGLLAYGANCFNMAFVLPYLGYGVYVLLKGKDGSPRRRMAAAAIGAYVGINAAALCAAIEFGIQPLIALDSAGQPLYCPYGLEVSIPAMMIGHLTLFGAAEVIFTATILAFIQRTAPEFYPAGCKGTGKSVYCLLALLAAAVPLGLLAQGTAWGEWGADEIAEVVSGGAALGYTPAGMQSGFSLSVWMPDYSLAGLPEAAAYILSAIIGTAGLIVVFRLVAMCMKKKTCYTEEL